MKQQGLAGWHQLGMAPAGPTLLVEGFCNQLAPTQLEIAT